MLGEPLTPMSQKDPIAAVTAEDEDTLSNHGGPGLTPGLQWEMSGQAQQRMVVRSCFLEQSLQD